MGLPWVIYLDVVFLVVAPKVWLLEYGAELAKQLK